MQVTDKAHHKTHWTIKRYANDRAFQEGRPFMVSEIPGNLFLNEGIAELLDLMIGAGGTTPFSNANARIGVGDSNSAAAAGQTDLQAGANKTYKAMAATYPSRAAQTLTFRSVFAGGDANYAWEEFVIDNGAGAAKTFNRKVSSQGVKANGQTWTIDVTITIT